jgi:hypothetical protein
VAFGNGDYSQLAIPPEVQGSVTAIAAGFRTSYILGPDLKLPPVAAPPPPGVLAVSPMHTHWVVARRQQGGQIL